MRRKTILALALVWRIPDGIGKLTLTLMKEICSPLMMLVIFGGMFVTAATAQTSLPTKILATAAQPTTNEVTQKRIDELIKQLESENVFTRQSAVMALGKIGDPRAVEPLIEALGDRSVRVRSLAAIALGEIEDARALEALIKALEDEDLDCRRTVAGALLIKMSNDRYKDAPENGRGLDEQTVKSLIKALGSGDDIVRTGALITLEKIQDALTVELMIEMLEVGDLHARRVAVRILGNRGDARSVDQLIEVMIDKNEDKYVRAAAARMLGKIGDARAVDPLIRELKSKNENMNFKIEVMEALEKIGDARSVDPLIEVMIDKNENTYVRTVAARMLGKIGDPRSIDPLKEVMNVKGMLQNAAKEALRKIDGGSEELDEFYPSTSYQRRTQTRFSESTMDNTRIWVLGCIGVAIVCFLLILCCRRFPKMNEIGMVVYASIVLMVCGGMLLYGGVSRIREYRRILKDDVRTDGVVKKLRQWQYGDDYDLVVVFKDEQGVQHDCKTDKKYSVNQKVLLIYYRPDPDLVIVDPSWETFVVPWFMGLGGLFMLIFTPVRLYLAFVRLFNKDKEESPRDSAVEQAGAAELQFRNACKNALADGKITVDEKQELKTLAKYFEISDQAMKEIIEDEVKIFQQKRKAR